MSNVKMALVVMAFLLSATEYSFAQKWSYVDFSFEKLNSGVPQKYYDVVGENQKEWYVVRFDQNLSHEENKYAILRFLYDMGCTVDKVTKEGGAYNFSYSWVGENPLVFGRLYVNGKFGYAVRVDDGFEVYKIEHAVEK